MKRTRQVTPKIQLKAEHYINLGYQRLLTFEVPGGGFDWYGRSPSNIVLSAYGLLQFFDMSKVYGIDRRIIQRTRRYLLGNQQRDGSWDLAAARSRRGSYHWGKVKTPLPVTAYVTWALLESGAKGAAVNRAVAYLRASINKTDDPYILALAGNALALHSPNAAATRRLLVRLEGLKRVSADGKTVSWAAASQTIYYGSGRAGGVETTALALLALIKGKAHAPTVNRGLRHLVKAKDAHGTWYSTQATILAMKALLGAAAGTTSAGDTRVQVLVDGRQVKELTITRDQSDLLHHVDLKPYTRKGVRRVELRSTRKDSNLMYQLVGRYYLPWRLVRQKVRHKKPLALKVAYDRTTLKKDDTVTATVTVEYLGQRPTFMVIADLGIPPGFKVLTGALVKARQQGLLDRFSITGRQLTLYLGRMEKGKPLSLSYRLKARYPIRAKTPRSVAYEYYNPDNRSVAPPVTFIVK